LTAGQNIPKDTIKMTTMYYAAGLKSDKIGTELGRLGIYGYNMQGNM